jgi:hypothetical protein
MIARPRTNGNTQAPVAIYGGKFSRLGDAFQQLEQKRKGPD